MDTQEMGEETRPEPRNEPTASVSPGETRRRSPVLVATTGLVVLSVVVLLLALAVDRVQEAAERTH